MSNKTELKLLARQQLEQNWSAVSGEEFLATEEASDFNAGTLVLVELTSNRQIQSIQEAAKQLVAILQNFSRLQEKFRTQGEEIEGWKQSLIYQSQELTHRKLEMEAWQDELQQSEEALKELEDQRQQVEATREEVQRQREGAERSRHELENAWNQLQSIEDLLSRLSGAATPAGFMQEQLNVSLEFIVQQQAILDQHWQKLEQQSVPAQDQQAELDQRTKHLEDSWKQWQKAQDSLEQACTELKLQQQSLRLKEEHAHTLAPQLQAQKDLYRQLCWLTNSAEGEVFGDEADMQALGEMPLEQLKSTIEELQQGLEKVSRFVHDQEEELTLQCQAVEELQEKTQQASEGDRSTLEDELEFERQRYQMLNETLVGQRRSLREREAILNKHQIVLLRRQEHQQTQESDSALKPILSQLKSQRQRQAEELHKLESQIEQVQSTVQQTQETVDHQSQNQETKRSELKQLELTLQSQKSEMAELWGRINTYQEILQPIQDRLNELRQQLMSVAQSLQQVGDEPMQAIAEIREIMAALTQAPELATF
jgi:chromosome segregation ATPase